MVLRDEEALRGSSNYRSVRGQNFFTHFNHREHHSRANAEAGMRISCLLLHVR